MKNATAEQMKVAREKLGEAIEKRNAERAAADAIANRLTDPGWDEAKDGAALDLAQRNLKNAQRLVEIQTDKVASLAADSELEQRMAGWGGGAAPSDGTAPGVSVLPSGRLGDKWEGARSEFRMLRAAKLLGERKPLDGLEAEMHQEGQNEVRDLRLPGASGNLILPEMLISGRSSGMERRDMLAETTTAGGYTVQTSVGNLIPILEPRLMVEALGATVMRGLRENIDFPRNDADAAAVWASEVATATETSPTFDRVQMSPERLVAFTDVSRQVVIQSSIDMENLIRRRLTFAVRKALDAAAINGSGSSDQPLGILNTSGVNDITVGTNGGVPTWALIVQHETETAIDNADFGKLAYLMTPGLAGLLKQTKRDVAGNGFIWEGPNMKAEVNGYRAFATTQMPSTLTKGSSSGTCHASIFGNWEELMIGQWGGIDILINPYTKGKEALVEMIVNSWWDVAVKHAASFCICNEFTLA